LRRAVYSGGGWMAAGVIDVDGSTFEAEVLEADVPVVVDFWAPWCGPCRIVGPELEKLAERSAGGARFVKVNVDENRELAMRFNVMSIPTILKFEKGSVAGQVVGAMRADELGAALGIG
jgi:thioredoxin 1